MRREYLGGKLVLLEGDITKVEADAITNAANSRLAGGGGVDGAIHRAGGPSIMKQLDEIRSETGGCPTGSAVVTGAGALPAKWVIHTVGPIYRDGQSNEPELLASCYRTCLQLAQDRGARTITFPSISTGVYGYPMTPAAEIALQTVAAGLEEIDQATFVLFGAEAFSTFEAAAERLFQ